MKLSFTKLEEIERRGEQAARKKKELVFHWRGGYLTRAVLEEILQCLHRAGESQGMHPRVRLNWPQAVLQVAYTGQPPPRRWTPSRPTRPRSWRPPCLRGKIPGTHCNSRTFLV